jgi:hypothetical protein
MLSLANPTLRLFIGAALISLSPVWVKLVESPGAACSFQRESGRSSFLRLSLLHSTYGSITAVSS